MTGKSKGDSKRSKSSDQIDNLCSNVDSSIIGEDDDLTKDKLSLKMNKKNNIHLTYKSIGAILILPIAIATIWTYFLPDSNNANTIDLCESKNENSKYHLFQNGYRSNLHNASQYECFFSKNYR